MNRVCPGRVSRAVICVLSVMVLCTAFPAAAPHDEVADVGVQRPVAASLPWIAGIAGPSLCLAGCQCGWRLWRRSC